MVVPVRKEVPAHPTPEKRCRLLRRRLHQVASYDTSRLKRHKDITKSFSISNIAASTRNVKRNKIIMEKRKDFKTSKKVFTSA